MTLPASLVELPKLRSTRYGVLRAAPFVGDAELPSTSDVVIIGGGLVGATIAYYLAKQNISVLLCEKAEIACEASSRAFGWVTDLLLNPVFQPMTQESKRLWAELQADIGEVGFRSDGLIHLADTQGELDFFAAWLDGSKDFLAPDTRMLDADGVAKRFPTAKRAFVGGLFSPSDGTAEPTIATTAIAEAARRAGAKIVTDCAVRGLDIQSGKVAGVFTEKGYVACAQAVCAANAWTRLFCGNHGIDIPQMYMFMSMGRTSGMNDLGPVGAGGQKGWAWRRQIDGCFSLGGMIGINVPITRDAIKLKKMFDPLTKAMGVSGKPDFGRDMIKDWRLKRRWNPAGQSPFEKLRVLGGSVQKVAHASHALNSAVFPEFLHAKVEELWAGPLVSSPDAKPIIGPVEAVQGFSVVTALGYGITWGPGVGKAVADSLAGQKPAFDLTPFSLARFGKPLELAI